MDTLAYTFKRNNRTIIKERYSSLHDTNFAFALNFKIEYSQRSPKQVILREFCRFWEKLKFIATDLDVHKPSLSWKNKLRLHSAVLPQSEKQWIGFIFWYMPDGHLSTCRLLPEIWLSSPTNILDVSWSYVMEIIITSRSVKFLTYTIWVRFQIARL